MQSNGQSHIYQFGTTYAKSNFIHHVFATRIEISRHSRRTVDVPCVEFRKLCRKTRGILDDGWTAHSEYCSSIFFISIHRRTTYEDAHKLISLRDAVISEQVWIDFPPPVGCRNAREKSLPTLSSVLSRRRQTRVGRARSIRFNTARQIERKGRTSAWVPPPEGAGGSFNYQWRLLTDCLSEKNYGQNS